MSTDSVVSFASLGLSDETLRSLEREQFSTPTPIQARAIPPAMRGADLIGCAATGTGKTAAFALPIIEKMAGKTGIRSLVLAPTRELALQIAEQFQRFSGARSVRCAIVIGGASANNQLRDLKRNPQVVIATPGRLVDHLEQGHIRLDGIEILVLDEADRMLDMGFKPQLKKILARLPRQRQTLLFSATMAGEVAEFAKTHLRDPVRVEVERVGTTAARAEQSVFLCSQTEKTALLLALLSNDSDTTLVFTRTKRRADKVARSLQRAGVSVDRIHADRSQSQRNGALAGFKSGKCRVLVATDIAARGIDVVDIGQVVNYDLPHVAADYVHRIGRTARNQASGRAYSFAAPDELPLLRDIERYTRALLVRSVVPRDSEVFLAELKSSAERQPSGPGSGGGHSRGDKSFRRPGRPQRSQPSGFRSDEGARSSAGTPSGGARPASTGSRSVFSGGPRRQSAR